MANHNVIQQKQVPQKPTPPPVVLQCGCCGYSAPKPEYKHKCYLGTAMGVAVVCMPLSLLVTLVAKIYAQG